MDVALDFDAGQGMGTLRWKAKPMARPRVNCRVYGSDEPHEGCAIEQEPVWRRQVANFRDVQQSRYSLE